MTELWTPPDSLRKQANVTAFMAAHGIREVAELYQRCLDIEWFWDVVVAELGIEFVRPYTRVRQTDGPAAATRWYVDATINAAWNCLDRWSEATPERIAVRYENEAGQQASLTYAELRRFTDAIARELTRLGLGPGDVAGLFMPMVPEAVAAFYACAKLGVTCMPLFSGFGPDAIMSRLQNSAAKALLTVAGTTRAGRQHAMADVAINAVAGLARPPQVVVIRTAATGPVPGAATEFHPLNGDAAPVAAIPVQAEHPLVLAYTSGTTGKPKGAVLGHAGTLAGVGRDAYFHLDVKPSDVLLWSTDMGWIMGPWAIIATGLPGATLALYDGAASYPDPDRLWRAVENLGVSVLGVSPSLIRGLSAQGSTPQQHDLSRLRILGATGEPWNAEAWLWLLHQVGRSRAPIINISGGTEVGAALLAPLPICPLKPSTVGGPALGMDVDVVDGTGAPLAEGIGELAVFQPWPSMTRGLWRDNSLFLETYWSRVPEVWMHGDWVSRDEDGFWFVHGRSDDALNVAGRRIGPSEVERILLLDELVNTVAAVALPHRTKGQAIWCFVTRGERAGAERPASSAELAARLSDAVAAQLGKPFRPEGILVVSDLPMTQSSKIARRLVRQAALGEPIGDLSGIANPGAIDGLRDALARHRSAEVSAQPEHGATTEH